MHVCMHILVLSPAKILTQGQCLCTCEWPNVAPLTPQERNLVPLTHHLAPQPASSAAAKYLEKYKKAAEEEQQARPDAQLLKELGPVDEGDDDDGEVREATEDKVPPTRPLFPSRGLQCSS